MKTPVPSKPLISSTHPHFDGPPEVHELVKHDCGCWERRSPRYTYAFEQCKEHFTGNSTRPRV